VSSGDEVTCISAHGIILRTSVDSVSRQGRYSRGVTVMDLRDGDSVASVAVIREGHLLQDEDEEEVQEGGEGPEPGAATSGNGRSQPSSDGSQ
jgi:DNA gyrase subunit A